MPELPEVQTIISGLSPFVLEKQIQSLEIFYPPIIRFPADEGPACLVNRKIMQIGRYGKYILIGLDNQRRLILHLRMTGQLLIKKPGSRLDKHCHLKIVFADNWLIYRDIRKFGGFRLLPQTSNFKDFLPGGRDALSITVDYFDKEKTRSPRRKLKAWLLDQSRIAGIGNIYADEICFFLGKHPSTALEKVNSPKLEKAIKGVLRAAIKSGGTTISDFRSPEGVRGLFQDELQIYGKKICPLCQGQTIKEKIAGRSTHFCTACQSLE